MGEKTHSLGVSAHRPGYLTQAALPARGELDTLRKACSKSLDEFHEESRRTVNLAILAAHFPDSIERRTALRLQRNREEDALAVYLDQSDRLLRLIENADWLDLKTKLWPAMQVSAREMQALRSTLQRTRIELIKEKLEAGFRLLGQAEAEAALGGSDAKRAVLKRARTVYLAAAKAFPLVRDVMSKRQRKFIEADLGKLEKVIPPIKQKGQ